jgi:hypothetical protein
MIWGCRRTNPSSDRAAWFEDVAEHAGLKFVYHSGHRDRYLLPEIMGGGVALLDIDGDGYLDVYFVQGESVLDPAVADSTARLFRNRRNGTFEDVTIGSGADVRGYGMGIAAGDFDNDGATDLYVTRMGSNVLLRNDGRGHFTDVTDRAHVANSGWSTGAAFLDYDGDGFLDLFVVHYVNWSPHLEMSCYNASGGADYCSPRKYNAPAAATLYHNNGDGTFSDVSVNAGVTSAVGNGLGIVLGDFNGDGRIDVFVANDSTPNHLWLNQGSGRFQNVALEAGCAVDYDGRAKAGMGTHAMDVSGTGRLDLLVVNLEGEADSFFRNQGEFFVDDTAAVGLRATSRPFTRFGAAMLDFDNDGRLDLFEANGRIARQSELFSEDPYAEPNLLFHGTIDGKFEEVLPRGGTAQLSVGAGRGSAFGDLDNDGGIDIVIADRDGPARLLHNVVANRGHWIMFRVIDQHGRDAVGATISATAGGRTVRRDVQTAYSYLSSNDPRVHVGLGTATVVSNVMVRWPDGRSESFGTFAADQIRTLRQGAGVVNRR